MASVTKENLKDVDESISVEEKQKSQKAAMKRYFYTLVTNAKKTIGGRQMGYYAVTLLLYNEVTKKKLSVDDWPSFIIKELNDTPDKWIDPKQLAKLKELYVSLYEYV